MSSEPRTLSIAISQANIASALCGEFSLRSIDVIYDDEEIVNPRFSEPKDGVCWLTFELKSDNKEVDFRIDKN